MHLACISLKAAQARRFNGVSLPRFLSLFQCSEDEGDDDLEFAANATSKGHDHDSHNHEKQHPPSKQPSGALGFKVNVRREGYAQPYLDKTIKAFASRVSTMDGHNMFILNNQL